MLITVLGSGTSNGVPLINCRCPVCMSSDPHDNRTRASIHISSKKASILIDTSVDFRQQALREEIKTIDAIFFTHSHADHLHGLDDLRPFTFDRSIPVYGNYQTIKEIKKRFAYIFNRTQKGGGKPKINLNTISQKEIKQESSVNINDIDILPVPVKHGKLNILGYRINNFAYLTDCSFIPDKSLTTLKGVSYLLIDALRTKPHPTHFSFSQAIEVSRKIGAKKIWFTHIAHNKSHEQLKQELPYGFAPAFDGLKIEV